MRDLESESGSLSENGRVFNETFWHRFCHAFSWSNFSSRLELKLRIGDFMVHRNTNLEARVIEEDVPSELSALLSELEADHGVQLSLGGVSVHQRHRNEEVSTKNAQERTAVEYETRALPEATVMYRDVADVRTILSLTWSMMILALLLVASAVGNIYQYVRRPDRIVVDGGTGRVLSINDRNYGKEEGVEFGPDRLTREDKIYITREFVKAVYQVDPATRPRDVERALTMMVPDSAVKFARWLKEKGVLDQQKAESWQTLWNPMDVSVDKNDPYTVSVIGKQNITKVINGTAISDSRQLRLTIKLVADNKGRADRNLRSGFLISSLDYQELNEPENRITGEAAMPKPAETTPLTALQSR